ncbi:MAG: hypothetical protein RJA78_149 [Actinomycetota bacterium]|jgi:hypothetical protein
MTNFDSAKFNKKLKKKIKKSMGSKKNVTVKTSNGLYFMGFIGAAIYYISTATDFWIGVVGVLKAIVWPAFLVYEALAKLT